MYELNAKIRDLVPYEPIAGSYPIRLDANESFLPLPDGLRAKIAETAAKTAFVRSVTEKARQLYDGRYETDTEKGLKRS